MSVTRTISASQNVTNYISREKPEEWPLCLVHMLNHSNRTKGRSYRTKLSRLSNSVWYLIIMFKTNKIVCIQNQTHTICFPLVNTAHHGSQTYSSSCEVYRPARNPLLHSSTHLSLFPCVSPKSLSISPPSLSPRARTRECLCVWCVCVCVCVCV